MDFKPCEHKIVSVNKNSPAYQAGVRVGEWLCLVNGERVRDLIDYTYLTDGADLLLSLRTESGEQTNVRIVKREGEALGLCFESGLMDKMQTCQNHCVFCFIDQMPPGGRDTLHVKDDDWRMSFVMGNYISLTNVDEVEFSRILSRRISPLYVSVHTTDPALRVKMMKNPAASSIMSRLMRLRDAGLTFHAQIVLCSGINDGRNLTHTLNELISLFPCCASVAIVPAGLTRFRERLTPLQTFTPRAARRVILQVSTLARRNIKRYGSRIVFLSDEWYLSAKMPLPRYTTYENFPQIENGVGLLRLTERDFKEAVKQYPMPKKWETFSVAGGILASRFFAPMMSKLLLRKRKILLYPIENHYFGGNVHVAGLLTGSDLVEQLSGKALGEALLIPGNMLREGENVFLDGMTLADLSAALHIPICPFRDGEECANLLFGKTEE